jgi:hypothetical protein
MRAQGRKKSPRPIAKPLRGLRPKEVRAPMARNPIIREHPANVSASISEESPHGCYDGWVYLGFEGEDVNGERVEQIVNPGQFAPSLS